MFYQLTNRDEREAISIVLDSGEVFQLSSADEGYTDLVAAARDGADADTIRRLAKPGAKVAEVLKLTERIDMIDGKIFFDGRKVRGRIAKHLKRMVKAEDPRVDALVNFLTKLQANPSEESRDALYRWLSDRDFTITDDGDIIAYKGLTAAGLSIHSGTAFVNAVKITGQIPNPVGAIVTMPRDRVNPHRYKGCSYGLHAGTWDYAHSFGQGMTVTVKINPADVVSVPDDCAFQKMRVCRYEVLESATQAYKFPVLSLDEDEPLPEEPNEFDWGYSYDPETEGLDAELAEMDGIRPLDLTTV